VVRLRDDLELANGLIRRALGDQIAIHIDLAPDLWPVYVDSGQVQQMLLNLALNARDSMAEAGTFTLIARNTFLPERRAKHYAVSSGDYVTLEVCDSGCGMDENTRQRAFEPFFTTKPTGRGTGLGLTMVFGCMKQCGGFVDLRSQPDQGTTFTLWFPRSRVEAVIPSVVPSRPPGGSARALLVEDNAAVAQVTTLILESAGYEVTATRDPIAAIALWNDDPRDVLVTDVEMPKMSGIRLSQRLREQSPELRTLFITAHSSEQVDLHLRAGRSAVVTKPFGREELLLTLANLLKAT
jgi:CheY-like chemotaxis protein